MTSADGPWTVLRLLRWTTEYLAGKGIESPRLDAEILLADLLGLTRVGLYLNFDRPLDPEERAGFKERVRRRAAREPVAYILGRKEFHSLDFQVSPDVLIPRPETEHLVEETLALVRDRPAGPEPYWLADVGTGSGAVAVTLARNLAQARVLAVDVSPAALDMARINARAHQVEDRIEFVQGDLLAPLLSRGPVFIAIAANLPYLSDDRFRDMAPEILRYEPRLALWGGIDGLDLIRRVVVQAPQALRPEGALLLEIDPAQAEAVRSLAGQAGFDRIRLAPDLAGRDRVAVLERNPSGG
jgi:release factor glutamine methyltransferase